LRVVEEVVVVRDRFIIVSIGEYAQPESRRLGDIFETRTVAWRLIDKETGWTGNFRPSGRLIAGGETVVSVVAPSRGDE